MQPAAAEPGKSLSALTLMIAALISIAVLLVTIALGSWQRAMLYAYYGIS